MSLRKVEQYVQAVIEVEALERALRDEAGREDTARALLRARATVKTLRGGLTGGELGAAHRRLIERA